MQSSRRFLEQADPLTVAELQALHLFSREPDVQDMDRALAFFALVCVYARCRVSDMYSVHAASWDADEDGCGYLVLRVGCHKTAHVAHKKRAPLPLIRSRE